MPASSCELRYENIIIIIIKLQGGLSMVWGIHAPPVPSHFLSTPFVPGSTSIKKPNPGCKQTVPIGSLGIGCF